MKIKVDSFRKIGFAIVMILVMILSGSAVANIFSITNPIRIVLVILFAYPFFKSIISEKDELLLCFIVYGIMFLFSILANPDNYRYILSVTTCICVSYAIVKNVEQKRIMLYFLLLMEAMAIISLIFYFLLNFTSIQLPFAFHDSFSNIRYGVGYIYNYLPYQKTRNCGMFWEPGLMASFMTYALVIDNIYFHAPNRFRTLIYVLSFITTNSSAGIVLLILTAAFLLFERYSSSNTSKREIILLVLVVFLSVFLFFNYDAVISLLARDGNTIVQKLFTDRLKSSERMQSVTFWWTNFCKHPILGNSITSISESFIWDTATSFMFVGLFGFLGGVYTISWIRGVWRLQLSFSCKVILLLICLVVLNKEPHGVILFSWILMFSFLTYSYTEEGNDDIPCEISSLANSD